MLKWLKDVIRAMRFNEKRLEELDDRLQEIRIEIMRLFGDHGAALEAGDDELAEQLDHRIGELLVETSKLKKERSTMVGS